MHALRSLGLRRPSAAFLLLAIGVVGGCGGDAVEGEMPEIAWAPSDRPWTMRPPTGITRRMEGVELPQARVAGLYDPAVRGFPVGTVRSEAFERSVRMEWTDRWAVDEARARIDRRISDEVREARSRGRDAEDLARGGVLLRLDHRTEWRVALEVIGGARASGREAWRIAIAVETAGSREWDWDGCIDLTPPSPPSRASAPDERIQWTVDLDRQFLTARIGADEWRFARTADPYAGGPALAEANANWAAIRATLARGSGPARVDVGRHVAWAYVVQTIAVALDAGRPRLVFEDPVGSCAASTAPHERRDPADRGGRDLDAGWVTAFGFLSAVALLAGTLRRPRRRVSSHAR